MSVRSEEPLKDFQSTIQSFSALFQVTYLLDLLPSKEKWLQDITCTYPVSRHKLKTAYHCLLILFTKSMSSLIGLLTMSINTVVKEPVTTEHKRTGKK